MPFDNSHEAMPVLPAFAPGRQGLRNLAYVLRNPVLWPDDHKWDFSHVDDRWKGILYGDEPDTRGGCGTVGCAIGLARRIWPQFREKVGIDPSNAAPIASMFKMSWDDASDIFLSPSGYGWPFYSVTPEDVADRIDAYLADHA